MKKITALILIVCFIITSFVFVSSAFDTIVEFDSEEYNPSKRGEWKQLPDGQYYNSEFEKYIDVEDYYENARNIGYDHMQLIDVEEYFYNPSGDILDSVLCFYIYNPDMLHFPMNGQYGVNYNCGTVKLNDLEAFMAYEYAEINTSTNNMFQRVFVPLNAALYSFSEFNVGERERTYTIDYLEFALYSSYEYDKGIIEYLVEKLVVNKTFTFTGANENKVKTVNGVNSPFTDLSNILGISKTTLLSEYPVNENGKLSLVFLDEVCAGEEDFDLYLYIYNPRLIEYKFLYAYFYIDGKYKIVNFDLVYSENTLSKFKLRNAHSLFVDDEQIREYYISSLYLYSPQYPSDVITVEARYVYSDIPNESYTPSMFSYDISDTLIDAPKFAGDGEYCFKVNEEYLITFESKDFEGFYVTPNDTEYSITSQGDNWMKILIIDDVSMLSFNTLVLYSYFPDASYPDLTISITRIVPDSATDEEKAAMSTGISYSPVDIDFTATRSFPVVLSEDELSENNVVYLTADVDGQIEIEGNYTYYRLDSSASGLGDYQTLSTLYFSLPNKYLQSTNIPLTDMFVSAIELEYSHAMLQPIIVTSDETLYSTLRNYVGKKTPNLAIATERAYNSLSSGNNVYFYDCNKLIGSDQMIRGSLIKSYDYYTPKDYYDTLNYLSLVESFDEFQEVMSVDELNAFLGTSVKVKGEFENTHSIINFDDKQTLVSFRDMSFDEMRDSGISFIKALLFDLLGTEQEIIDTVENISCIETLSNTDIEEALALDNTTFSNTYYVSLSDVPSVKAQMQSSLENDESFVFIRYDVFDAYSDYVAIQTEEGIGGTEDSTFLYQTKYYKGLDVLSLEAKNHFTSKLYKVVMDPMDTVGGGATSPKPLDPKPIVDVFKDNETSKFEEILGVLGMFLGVILLFFVVIKVTPYVAKIVKAIRNNIEKREKKKKRR